MTTPISALESNTIDLDDWLRFMGKEYLTTFIREGGASVKFAVTPEEQKIHLSAALQDRCRELGYLFVELDAGTMPAYMPHEIFFRLAQQVDWRLLARLVILRFARERGYYLENIDPDTAENIFEVIAGANRLEAEFVLNEIRPDIMEQIYRTPGMSKYFRIAMTQLCLSENTREGEPYLGQSLLDWLTGSNRNTSGVRTFAIYTAITRNTARSFIESALYWIRYAGYSGTVIMFDNSRVTLSRNPRDGLRYYTRAMTVEHYELLREFIDSVDRLTGTLLVVATNQDFLQDVRGYTIYPALQTRVMDDVRDRNLVNPIASLVRLS